MVQTALFPKKFLKKKKTIVSWLFKVSYFAFYCGSVAMKLFFGVVVHSLS